MNKKSLSIVTVITKPDERQDPWREALACYSDLADEVVVVCGTKNDMALVTSLENEKIKPYYLEWDDDWDYIELPRHLNFGLKFCTMDWVLKMDIDHFIHEGEHAQLRGYIDEADPETESIGINKLNWNFGVFHSKAHQSFCFRRDPDIQFGEVNEFIGDLCYAIKVEGTKKIQGYDLPYGRELITEKSWVHIWNYDYTFKTEDVARQHFWRFVRAYRKWANDSKFGEDEQTSFDYFIRMMKEYVHKGKHIAKEDQHPKYIREKILSLTPDQCGYNLWGNI